MVLSTLVYIALIIIVIIIIVVLLRFLFNVIFILPVTLEHDHLNKLVYAQSEQYRENQSATTRGFPLTNITNASSSMEDAKNMSVIEGTMNRSQ
jgi:hypothetical protein